MSTRKGYGSWLKISFSKRRFAPTFFINFMVKDISNFQNVFFIGVAGVGMSAIAQYLKGIGKNVSGSDRYFHPNEYNKTKEQLEAEGIRCFLQDGSGIDENTELVVVSTAIEDTVYEVQKAREYNIPVIKRSELLALIAKSKKTIAVAGTSGKSTTSAILFQILADAGLEPSIISGAGLTRIIKEGKIGNAAVGKGDWLIIEADESDGSFLKFYPKYAIVTNIENDHMDHYGSEENIYLAFTEFLSNVKDGGAAILCMDSPKLRKLASETTTPVISYGLEHEDARYQARNIRYSVNGTCYDLYVEGVFVSTVELIVPGQHNVLNSLGAIATAQAMGIPMQQILPALKKFSGARRRFETKGRIDGIWVVDDYAHHPTEIGVTLKAARQTQPKRLICAFQPHRYTRTKLLFDEFSRCFADCDQLILTDIYSAGEFPIDGVSGASLAEAVTEATQQQVTFIPTLPKLEEYLFKIAEPGDLIMTVGAGDIFKVGEELVTELERGR